MSTSDSSVLSTNRLDDCEDKPAGSQVIKDRRGSSAVESALVLGVLLFLLLAFFDFGRAVYAYAEISQVSREVARYAVMHPGDVTGAQQVAGQWSILNLVPADDVDVVFDSGVPGSVRVAVSYEYHPISFMVAQIVGASGFTLESHSTMLLE